MKSIKILAIVLIGLSYSCKQTQKTSHKTQNIPPTVEQKIEGVYIPNGYKAHIISLPKSENESDLRVEFYPSMMSEVDCNLYSLRGDILEYPIPNKGAMSYYTFNYKNIIATTKRACFNNIKTAEWINGPKTMIQYNSHNPTYVVVPEDMKVVYRIWSKSNEYTEVKQSNQ